jgi:glycerol-3-phosphate cytidylyltransferase-like family protein
MTLWFEVVIKPIKERLGKMLIWCDNCRSHKTTSVMEVIREIGVDVVFLPKNMTGELQVLDQVVNGPLKAHIRTNRANRLYKCFQSYKEATAISSALPPHLRKKLDF